MESSTAPLHFVSYCKPSQERTHRNTSKRFDGKNLVRSPNRRRLKTRVTHLTVGTYNCRSICSEAQLSLLMKESERIKFDVIGLCEMKRKKSLSCTWSNGTGVFLGSRKENSTSGGIGFIVAPGFLHKIEQVSFPSHRIGILNLRMNKNTKISLIQVYAPTADKDEIEHADFYDELRAVVRKCRSYYKVIAGDFNAYVGPRRKYDAFLGPHSDERWNETGERLASFCETAHFYHGNSRFQKPRERRWTHISPNGLFKHELDHFLCNHKIFTDVAVVPSFQTGSDHRLLRAKLHFDKTKATLERMAQKTPSPTILDVEAAQRLAESKDFGEMNDLDEDYEKLEAAIADIRKTCRKKKPNHVTSRISEETRQLLEKRRNLKRTVNNHLEMTLLNKLCRERVTKDHKEFTERRLRAAAESRASVKTTARSIAEYHQTIPCLKDSKGEKVTSRYGMETLIKEYYEELFRSSTPAAHIEIPLLERRYSILSFTSSEIRHAVDLMPNGRCGGEDKLVAEDIKACGHPLYVALARRFTRYVREARVPTSWQTSKTILLHKKGDKEDLNNYRPITLLPVLYKIFTRCLLARIRRTLEEAQPIEQAGFRGGYSTIDHIGTCTRVIEACAEHQVPLVMVFIDYCKAFDSVEHHAVWRSLLEQGIEQQYVDVLKNCYSSCTTMFRPFSRTITVPIRRGVRQGDPISPSLFSAVLESVIRKCSWDGQGININGRMLNHFRFADDIVVLTHTPQEAEQMIQQLNEEGKKAGLHLNIAKTKVMRNRFADPSPIRLGQAILENTDEYVYLGRLINMDNNLKPEIVRRKRAAWAAYNTIKPAVSQMKNSKLKAELFNTTVIPALCYGSETWALTKALEKQLKTTQLSIERHLVGFTLHRQRSQGLHNADIRRLSKVADALEYANKSKHRWAGHVMRRTDDRWSRAVIEWYPRGKERPLGRPPTRWSDSLSFRYNITDDRKKCLVHWSTRAQNRNDWKLCYDPQQGPPPRLKNGSTK
ncbi:hypothetical protein Y032_0290g1548 [Ancylostoma ceylanicum]|uniref:Reverse transcriptase domain-containing protein n=1 Tax=Ancylostoma ceylanicum TaxID=53326 RepID=A0A016S5B2_9BILA|nr:hypothetical protein Y032_0290g1548 [Ancylostoma ceylanicum]